MSRFLADRIVAFLVQRGVLERENEQIIKYGYEIIYYSTMQIVLLIILGVILGKGMEAIIFVFSFSMIRRHVGGYHATSKTSCTLLTSILLLIVIFLSEHLKEEQGFVFILMTLFYIFVFFFFAPVESGKKFLSKKQKEKNRKYGFIFAASFTIIAYVLLKYTKKGGREIIITFFIVAILMAIEIMKGEKNEKSNNG